MRYTAQELEAMPTLATGQADDLKVDTGRERVWLSRVTREDGAEFDNEVTHEVLTDTGRWISIRSYEG